VHDQNKSSCGDNPKNSLHHKHGPPWYRRHSTTDKEAELLSHQGRDFYNRKIMDNSQAAIQAEHRRPGSTIGKKANRVFELFKNSTDEVG
jgi:hypothetical protein